MTQVLTISMVSEQVKIIYFSDMLCVWAYVAQIRIDELTRNYGQKIRVENHFISIFGSTDKRIGRGWKDRGGFEGFAEHVASVSHRFDHIRVNPEVWRACIPTTSLSSHLFVKAVQGLEDKGVLSLKEQAPAGRTMAEELIWRIRCAFFENARDISQLSVLFDIAEQLGLPATRINDQILNGAAMAALHEDFELQSAYRLEGSPSFLMNDGRQKLYGNVGYRVLDANVAELLHNPVSDASWC